MTRPAPATLSMPDGADPKAFDGVGPLADTDEDERALKSTRSSASRNRTSALSPL
jgi:hypothetical protein